MYDDITYCTNETCRKRHKCRRAKYPKEGIYSFGYFDKPNKTCYKPIKEKGESKV